MGYENNMIRLTQEGIMDISGNLKNEMMSELLHSAYD